METEVKICGLKTATAMQAALDGGARYAGLVFFAASPRNVDFETASSLAEMARGRARIVALVVDPTDADLGRIVKAVSPDVIQLHGLETPERVRAVRARYGRPVIKAIKVETAADADEALAYKDIADLILFDAKMPAGRAEQLPGGNGLAFDWHALARIKDRVPYMLAGGLTPDNVADAIRLTGAAAVDVSSGVESRPGEKNPELIHRFLRAVKTAKQTP